MDYDQRINHIKRWFKQEMTKRFSMPKELDPMAAATDVIEGINSHLPSKLNPQMMDMLLEKVGKEVTRNARSRTLPLPKDFIDACSKCVKTAGAAHTEASVSRIGLDTLKITEARIRAGEAISELFLRGTMRANLIANTSITDADLAPYEVDSAAHTQ
jgi:hypothetical protein